MSTSHIRNFCIIAHVDHGKSTLADRLLESTSTIPRREMMDQVLDQMDLERERGITIKAQAVRIAYSADNGNNYQLNLIDTPGHVDFSYEVSRSLRACEGALLVVDASQGVQAQTIANVYIALEHDLTLIPIINKIDLPAAEPDIVAEEMEYTFGFKREEILFISAKSGSGIKSVLNAIVDKIPNPNDSPTEEPLRALVFDSSYDQYKGVIAYIRVVNGNLQHGEKIKLLGSGHTSEAMEVGTFRPAMTKLGSLKTGEVGYVATGLKNLTEIPVGDTITVISNPASESLTGYQPLKPMVFAGLFPTDGESYRQLGEALEKLQLNDAALSFQPESSVALGFGFRCGFLGMLHMDIVQERLEREYGMALLTTAPSVAYKVIQTDGSKLNIENPSQMPQAQNISEILEPWLDLSIITPSQFIGPMMDLVTTRRGEFLRMEYLQGNNKEGSPSSRVQLEFSAPLSEILMDFFDQLKSRSQGYASMDYVTSDYRQAQLVKLDILVNSQPVDALSLIIHRERAYQHGRSLVIKLKTLIPRQMFEVPIQASVGSKVVARETIRALRKNVIAKCYGGDITRKRKLLEKQAEGKKRMKKIGQVEIPQEAFLAILDLDK
jgi:GTP-binding protein LepA